MLSLLKIVVIGLPSACAWWVGCRLLLLGMHGMKIASPDTADALLHNMLDPVIEAATLIKADHV